MGSLEILVTPNGRQSVIVVGAGPAGLTAAYRLTAHGHRITLLSASSMPGEHFRSASDPPSPILGCHQATWTLLHSLGLQRSPSLFVESTLEFLLPDGRLARYPKTRFPTPLQQLLTIGRFAGLSPADRWKLLSWLEQLWEGTLHLAPDLEHRTAHQWLESLGYGRASLQSVWYPLAAWLTGNDLEHLSADAFVMALKPFFLSGSSNSRIWVPRQPWDHLLIEPIKDTLIKNGATLTVRAEAVGFEVQEDRMIGLRLKDGAILHADWYVSAVAPPHLTPLLPERWLTRYAYFQHIADLNILPCTIIHARTTATLTSPRHILLSSGPFHSVACIPSEPDRHLKALLTIPRSRSVTDSEHVFAVLRSLNLHGADDHFTGFSQHETTTGLLSLSPGAKMLRPVQQSPISNLLLVGAWTDTGWPANLESAIVSGERCAEIILQHQGFRP